MKKTLITLLALAGVAAAATDGYLSNPDALTWDGALTLTSPTNNAITSGNAGLAWSEETGNLVKSWELSFTLSVKSVSGSSDEIFGSNGLGNGAYGTVLNITSAGAVTVSSGRVAASLSSADGLVQIGDGSGGYGEGVAVTLTFVRYVDVVSGSSDSGLLTLKVGESDAVSTVFNISTGDSTIFNNADGNSRFWTNGGAQNMTGITLKQGGNMIVPEPATATLSLLALAGLAARRRRK